MSPGRTSGVFDAKLADALLNRRLQALEDTRPALRAVAAVIRSEFREQFRTGDGWEPLNARYAARKAKRGNGSRILVDRGLLEASLTRTGVRYAKERVTKDLVEVRSTDPVGNLLRGGTRSMPARDPADVNRRSLKRRSRDVLLVFLASGGR